MKEKKPTQLTWGLFYSPRQFFGDVKIWWKRLKFLLRHGYAEPFLWQYCDCFTAVTKDWAQWMKDNRTTNIMFEGIGEDKLGDANDTFYTRMMENLELMETDGWDGEELKEATSAAKRLFEDFGNYFFGFWD